MTNWETYVKKLTPYVPGEQPKEGDVIKLNTNESPYPPSPRVAEALRDFDAAALRKYPDPVYSGLRSAIASYHGVSPEQVFVGVGSDDVLAMAFLTFFSETKRPVFFPDITYSFYDVWCELFGIEYVQIPVAQDLSVCADDYIRSSAGVVLANPNAPTGLSMDRDELIRIISAHHDEVVIVDEAYVDFGGESVLPYVSEYKNLLVVRTFSKSRSMAGSRIGYCIGDEKLIGYMMAARDSFNSYTMDSLTQELGIASISDETYFKSRVAEIVETREWSEGELTRLGFSYPKSSANFIFAAHERVPAAELYERLKDRGIYVRYFKKPRIDNYLRITIGTRAEMEQLFLALSEIIEDYS